jgi:hypothetical protein
MGDYFMNRVGVKAIQNKEQFMNCLGVKAIQNSDIVYIV